LKTTIIIPTYNEAENLPKLIPELLKQPVDDLHLLIVDDLSPDGTGEIAEQLAAKHPTQIEVLHRDGPRGLGRAYIHGFEHVLNSAQPPDYIGQMDCDFSHPPDKLPEFVAKIADCDLVVGSRYIPGGGVDRNWPWWRKRLSRFGNWYALTILGLPLSDVTGAYRLWRRELLARIPYQEVVSNGYVFLIEIAHLANKAGARFGQVPIYFADRRWGQSKMNFTVQIEAALRVWQVKWHYRKFRF
jgi:dolichol-phosphate mannosyltransferase